MQETQEGPSSLAPGMDDVSVKEFQVVIDEWLDLRAEIDRIEASVKPLNEKKYALQKKIESMFEATGLDSFRGTKGGVEKRTVDYANQPSEETRGQFIKYLLDSGELDNVITFHQGRLTSWFKAQKEEKGFMFVPPGMEDLKQRTEIRKRK